MNTIRRIVTLIMLLGAAGPVFGQEAVAGGDGKAELDLRRVTLFSSGVGYFEREATVSGDATAELRFRTEQINDILKSLVVQDLDGGSIDVVTYTPQEPLERTLASFGVNVIDNPSLIALYGSLRGEPVSITGPRALEGIIYGTEVVEVAVGDRTVPRQYLSVLTREGLISLEIHELQGVRLKDEKTNAELLKALAALAKSNDQDKKGVTIEFSGQGQRRVRASFLLETPVWKTSYRLVLSDEREPFLQGWAIVENTTEEDWENVPLSLISGRPISFRMDLYTPIYIPRPVEDLELYASLRAPQFESGFGGFGGGGMGGFAGSHPGFGRAEADDKASPRGSSRARRLDISAAEVALAPAVVGRSALDVAAGVASVATAAEAGELFEYAIDAPVSIRRQQSAMLPIVNAKVAGEKLSIYSPEAHPKHPMNGLKFKNGTDLNLMQGPVTIFDDDVYAGDAKLPDLRPGEERLVAYALDLATEVSQKGKPNPTQMIGLSIRKGVLIRTRKEFDEREYTVRNKADKAKTVIIEQKIGQGWELVEPEEAYERTENALRFKVDVAGGISETLIVRLEIVRSESVALTSADIDTIQQYLTGSGRVMTAEIREALEKVIALRKDLDNVRVQREAKERDLNEIVAEQERVRENLKVLQQNTDPYKRQLTKLDELETQIEKLRSEIKTLRQSEEQKRKAFEDYLMNLTIGT